MGKIIAFNGPPRSGKNSVAAGLIAEFEKSGSDTTILQLALAEPLRKAAGILLGIDVSTDAEYEQMKDVKIQRALTLRETMIAIGEQIIKPKLGPNWFVALSLAKAVPVIKAGGVVVITDLGFQDEADELEAAAVILGCELRIIRVFREGHDFRNDSREYIMAHRMFDCHNNGTIEEAVSAVKSWVR